MIWEIWKERNCKVFKDKEMQAKELAKKIVRSINENWKVTREKEDALSHGRVGGMTVAPHGNHTQS